MNQRIFQEFLKQSSAAGGRSFRVQRVGPLGGILLFLLLIVGAVVGLVGFAALAVGFAGYSVVKAFLPRAGALKNVRSAPREEPTITVLDADGKTVATVPRHT